MPMPRQNPAPISDDHGWLITPRALTSVATVVGLVYTLHAPVRYVLQLSESVDMLSARVAALETEIDQQRGTIAAAEAALAVRARDEPSLPPGARGTAKAPAHHTSSREP
jgi:outer membrane murein-binding lipoprotein Lpp